MESLALKRLQRKLAAEEAEKQALKLAQTAGGRPMTADSRPATALTSAGSPKGSPLKPGISFNSDSSGSPIAIIDEAAIKKALEEEKIARNTAFGLPIAPSGCFAVGKASSAAVWWTFRTYTHEEERIFESAPIIKWEISRYRMDKGQVTKGEWKLKGSVVVDVASVPKLQYTVQGLSDGHQYKFSVRGISIRGPGLDSQLSNAVSVDAELPTGWMRFHDRATDRMFYANLKTRQTSWQRPEYDPFFLEEQIALMFNRREIEHLKELFLEDIAHCKYIFADRLVDMGREIGELIPQLRAAQLVEAFGTTDGLTHKITTWIEFINLMYTLKLTKKTPVVPLPKAGIFSFLTKQMHLHMKTSQDEKLGPWRTLHNSIVGRDYYINTRTHEKRWTMPDEVRFYISDELLTRLYGIFNAGHIEAFKRYFSIMDIDASGDLSAEEIKSIFDRIGIEVTDQLFGILMHIIDLNGNGSIEYDEFCFMMYTIAKKFHIWKSIRRYNERLQMEENADGIPVRLNFSFLNICTKISALFIGEVALQKPPAQISLKIGPPPNASGKQKKSLFSSKSILSGAPKNESDVEEKEDDEGEERIMVSDESIDGALSVSGGLSIAESSDCTSDYDDNWEDNRKRVTTGNNLMEKRTGFDHGEVIIVHPATSYMAHKEPQDDDSSAVTSDTRGSKKKTQKRTKTDDVFADYMYEDELDAIDHGIEVGSFLHNALNTNSRPLKAFYSVAHVVDVAFDVVSDQLYRFRQFLIEEFSTRASKVAPNLVPEAPVHGYYCFCGCRRITD